MKKIFILSLWICLGYTISTQAQINDYSTYQLAFRKGGKIITLQPDLNSLKAVTAVAYEGTNELSQHLIFKRQSEVGFLIAPSAAPNKFLKRTGNDVTLAAYEQANEADYLWIIRIVKIDVVNTSDGGKLTALLTTPNDPNQALTLQDDGTMKMSIVDYSISNDPYRLYVLKKIAPGKF